MFDPTKMGRQNSKAWDVLMGLDPSKWYRLDVVILEMSRSCGGRWSTSERMVEEAHQHGYVGIRYDERGRKYWVRLKAEKAPRESVDDSRGDQRTDNATHSRTRRSPRGGEGR